MLSLAAVQFRLHAAHEPVPVRRGAWADRYVDTERTLDSLRGMPARVVVRGMR